MPENSLVRDRSPTVGKRTQAIQKGQNHRVMATICLKGQPTVIQISGMAEDISALFRMPMR